MKTATRFFVVIAMLVWSIGAQSSDMGNCVSDEIVALAKSGFSKAEIAIHCKATGASGGGANLQGCKGLPGVWSWFKNGDVTIKPNGTHKQGRLKGTWQCSGNIVNMKWNHGFVDKLKLSSDGRKLTGKGWRTKNPSRKHNVSGRR